MGLWIALILLLGTDDFSAQQTGGIVGRVIAWLFPGASPATPDAVNFALRKGAHLSEYGVLGLLAFHAIRLGAPARTARAVVLALLLVLGVSGVDEVRQTRSPVRTGSARDVGIDLTGASLALVGRGAASGRTRRREAAAGA